LLVNGCRNSEEESNVSAVAAAQPTPVEASAALQPTFTPTPHIVPTASSTATATIAPTPTVSPTPSATPLPAEQLVHGRQLHRVGDYANARTILQQLLAIPNLDSALQQSARDELVRVHMAEGAYSEALTLLPPPPAVSATGATTAPMDDLAAKAEFLRGEALAATGAYTQAIAAYWRFLEAAPWATEVVQPRIATAYLAAGDRNGAAAAYRRAADAATDTVVRARLLETLATTYAGAGRYADAVKVYEEILAVAKNEGYGASIQY